MREDFERAKAALAEASTQQQATQPSDDDWIPWTGGESPVDPDQYVHVRDMLGEPWQGHGREFDWSHHQGDNLNIVAYRIVGDKK